MKGESVVYDGREVPTEGFRVFIYGANQTKKLANSWSEFKRLVGSGLWFVTPEEVEQSLSKEDDVEVINLPYVKRKKRG